MKLTGKCKKDFGIWIKNNEYVKNFMTEFCSLATGNFHYLPKAMKFSVYQQFFDSVGIVFWVAPYFNHDLGVMNQWAAFDECGLFTTNCDSRGEAQVKAIEMADELHNQSKI